MDERKPLVDYKITAPDGRIVDSGTGDPRIIAAQMEDAWTRYRAPHMQSLTLTMTAHQDAQKQ